MIVNITFMLKTIIIEDDPIQLSLLSNYVDEMLDLQLVGKFYKVEDAIKFNLKESVDLIILDVELPLTSGVEFLEIYKPEAHVILISSSEKYAINGYQHCVDDYLLKPISFPRFSVSINRLINKLNKENLSYKPFLFIKDKGVYTKVLIDDILYIQSASEYVTIYTKERRIILYSSMDSILSKLNNRFIRIHRSSIVNLDKIDKIEGNTVEVNGSFIAISKTYHDSFMTSMGLKMK
ncbi:MAG: hypothetical protein RI883_1213 [Bacteroidota bacterium]|jgi:DNA-binding LytR/AlgR family response regulator